LKSLEKLVDGGAVILGPKPERTTSLKDYPGCDTEVKTIADKIWGKCDGKTIFSNKFGKGMVYWGKSLEQVLKELSIHPDFEVKGIDNCDQHIDYIHRQTKTEEIYFVSNSSPKEEKTTCVFRVNENKIPEIWDAETGLIQREIDYSKGVNGISIDFILDPLASRLVVFRNQSEGKNDPGINYDLQYGFHKKQNRPPNDESIDITDNWEVRFDSLMGGPKSFHMAKLSSWTDIDNDGVRFYSGKASYNRSFSVNQASLSKTTEAYVVFQDIQEMAHVYVNDQDCGIVWTPPYKANITPYLKAGKNCITVEVINNWNNRIVGDVKNPDGKQYTQTNIKYKFKGAKSLLKSGLMGKAEIFLTN
jgi:deoxycytidine triphosphate deaminase